MLSLNETSHTMAAASKNCFETEALHFVEHNLDYFSKTHDLRCLASACCPYVPESDYRYLEDETQREATIAKDKEFFKHLLEFIETLDMEKFAPHLEKYSYLKEPIQMLSMGLKMRKITVGMIRTNLGRVCYDEFLDLLYYPE